MIRLVGRSGVAVGRWWVEGDPEPDLDVPAGDPDAFDEQAQQLPSLVVVEGVDDGVDAGGEVVDAAGELVVASERGCSLARLVRLRCRSFGGKRLRWRGAGFRGVR